MRLNCLRLILSPGDDGVLLERRLALLAGLVDRGVDRLELAADSVGDDFGPGFIGFTKGYGVAVLEGFVGQAR